MNTVVEAHKARAAEVNAAIEQHREIATLKPVPKGKKEQPLELHPDDFVRIKAQKIADVAKEKPTVAVDVGKPVDDKASDSYAAHIEVGPFCNGSIGAVAYLLPICHHCEVYFMKFDKAGLALFLCPRLQSVS